MFSPWECTLLSWKAIPHCGPVFGRTQRVRMALVSPWLSLQTARKKGYLLFSNHRSEVFQSAPIVGVHDWSEGNGDIWVKREDTRDEGPSFTWYSLVQIGEPKKWVQINPEISNVRQKVPNAQTSIACIPPQRNLKWFPPANHQGPSILMHSHFNLGWFSCIFPIFDGVHYSQASTNM